MPEVLKYISNKKELQNTLLKFINDENNDENDFIILFSIIETQKILENKNEFNLFLRLITRLSENHHRNSNFSIRFQKIIHHIKTQIKQTFSNIEIFNIFKRNKLMLLFLFNQEVITMDSIIYNQLVYSSKSDNFYFYFLPELKSFFDEDKFKSIENQLIDDNSLIFDKFEEHRLIGENDSFICSLIRKDSVKDFISHVNKNNIPLSSKIKNSIFETHPFLIKNEKTSLIEYSAFYGSIEIFQYLRLNNVQLTSSLWLYSIHGRNAEIIHLLEGDKIEPPNGSFEKVLKESIKCHHNEIAEYIENNLIDEKDREFNIKNKLSENIFAYCFHYYNYIFCPKFDLFENHFIIFYLCQYNYYEMVKLFLQNENASSIINTPITMNKRIINLVNSNKIFNHFKF